MDTSYFSSQLKRTGRILRSGAEGQIKEYNQKFNSIKGIYDSLLSDLIVQDFNNSKAFNIALKLFGESKVRFAAVDGTEYIQPLFDLVIFFGGAYALKGNLTFHKDSEPRIEYDQKMIRDGHGISSCVPMYINEVAEVDQTILDVGDQDQMEMTKPLTDETIIKNTAIADQIMSFSELYLAYRLAIDPKEKMNILLLDRSLSTMNNSLIYDTSIRKLWKTCALHGFEVDGEKININDLGYGRHRILNENLTVPPHRGEYLRYSIICLLEKRPLKRDQLYAEIGAVNKDRRERADRFIQRSLEEKYLLEENQTLKLNPRYAKTWSLLKKAVTEIGEQLYQNEGEENPMKIKHGDKSVWLTTLDFQFLTLFSLHMLVEECWRNNILLLGITKDTSARDFKNHVIPVCLNEGIWNLKMSQEELSQVPNTDRMFLQSISLNNHEKLRVPWSLVEYDSAFQTIIPEYEKRRKGYVSGAIQNRINLERTFLKSYIQLSQAKSDPQMRSNVLLIDRIAYPDYDLQEETTHKFLHNYGGAEENLEPIIYINREIENPIQNLTMTILHAMSKSNIPEAFGHNVPLFMADKIAKYHFTEFKRIIDTTKYWIMNNPNLRRFVFYMSTFRERRSEIESGRRMVG